MFAGDCLRVTPLEGGLVELCFDRAGESINKLDDLAVQEFRSAVQAIAADTAVRGVLVTSAKGVFIVGADITEFGRKFRESAETVARGVLASNQVFAAFEDLAVPTVAVINGYALGGGLELALACAKRIVSQDAMVGVPEIKLGLFPGFGGTVRLARVGSPQTAVAWVTSGKPATAAEALQAGVVDAAVPAADLRAQAMAMLWQCVEGRLDWQAAQRRKRVPATDADAVYDAALAQLNAQASRHQPAAAMAVTMMRAAGRCDRTRALELEAQAFGAVTQTQAARSMVRTFLNEQAVKKLARKQSEGGRAVRSVAVIGAGIMGGGIAYTTASRGIPVRMKDIAQPALDLGMGEARRQLERQVRQGRSTQDRADAVLASITPQLGEAGLDAVDLLVEAVVENLGVKHKVLAALETTVAPGTVLASNTSSLRIDDIAGPLARPEDLVGLHFFNPVPVMPLVEVVRGSRSSAKAVATATAYAAALGKTPIVVRDCPGFLVNRILTPYIVAFCDLVAEGLDYERVDAVMEAFGWPMGPAYLEDVVGMDTGNHVIDVICAGYPERMRAPRHNAIAMLVQMGRLGQKSGGGFYDYDAAGGKPRRSPSPTAQALVAEMQGARNAGDGAGSRLADDAIVERMMLPMVLEAIRALEEGVVGTAGELDVAMLLGIGFPAYLGGPLQYADWLGARAVLERADALTAGRPAYAAPRLLRDMAAAGRTFYAS
jgi:3-hydroxyacyl-CoA dehydrogenase/enoyl-CoA hydratase/3-hydroxybutyryl-CoA epimerase/enoyl-CoA isomerase